MSESFIIPDWPAPKNVIAAATTRKGGFSEDPYRSFNLATHVGDDIQKVAANRQYLKKILSLPQTPVWLNQVHGTTVIALDPTTEHREPNADGSWSAHPHQICVVMTADCLPVLLCDKQGTCVAALHAGWQGLCTGILEAGVKSLPKPAAELIAWLGPAISQEAYEIGAEVRDKFIQTDPQAEQAFRPSHRSGHAYLDLYKVARQRLNKAGVTDIYGGEYCTFRDKDLFYSYRRDNKTGRMASLIYLI